jgi:hypothetical protein
MVWFKGEKEWEGRGSWPHLRTYYYSEELEEIHEKKSSRESWNQLKFKSVTQSAILHHCFVIILAFQNTRPQPIIHRSVVTGSTEKMRMWYVM